MFDIVNNILIITENIFRMEVFMRKIYSVIFILLAFILSVGCFSGYYSTFAFADKKE